MLREEEKKTRRQEDKKTRRQEDKKKKKRGVNGRRSTVNDKDHRAAPFCLEYRVGPRSTGSITVEHGAKPMKNQVSAAFG